MTCGATRFKSEIIVLIDLLDTCTSRVKARGLSWRCLHTNSSIFLSLARWRSHRKSGVVLTEAKPCVHPSQVFWVMFVYQILSISPMFLSLQQKDFVSHYPFKIEIGKFFPSYSWQFLEYFLSEKKGIII